jgi:hypothetical protein
MLIEIKIKKEPNFNSIDDRLHIINNITLDSFKFLLKNSPEMLLELVEKMEEELKPKGPPDKVEFTPNLVF